MRKSRFTDEQMVAIIRESDRDGVGKAAKKHGVREQTLYIWKKRFGTKLKLVQAEPAFPNCCV